MRKRQSPIFTPIGAVLAVCTLTASCSCRRTVTPPGDAPPPPAPAAQPKAPAGAIGIELPASGADRFRVFVASCREGACTIELALVRGGSVISRAALAWPSPTATLSPEPTERNQGVGDPLAIPETTSWTSGGEEAAVISTFRSVQLAKDRRGVLVTQVGGVEHVKRSHALYEAESGQVKLVWEGADGPGPFTTTTALVRKGDRDVLVMFRGFDGLEETEPEEYSATALGWKDGESAPQPIPAREVVGALAVGDFRSAQRARVARDAAPKCLHGYWAVKLDQRFTLAAMSTQKQLLDDLAARTRACAPELEQRRIDPSRLVAETK